MQLCTHTRGCLHPTRVLCGARRNGSGMGSAPALVSEVCVLRSRAQGDTAYASMQVHTARGTHTCEEVRVERGVHAQTKKKGRARIYAAPTPMVVTNVRPPPCAPRSRPQTDVRIVVRVWGGLAAAAPPPRIVRGAPRGERTQRPCSSLDTRAPSLDHPPRARTALPARLAPVAGCSRDATCRRLPPPPPPWPQPP